jgi:pyruvyltransferase
MQYYWYKGAWSDELGNIGDIITPHIIKHLTGIMPERCSEKASGKLLSCGSVAEFIEDNDVVWGSGLIQPMPLEKKTNVTFLMVRGPDTRRELMRAGYEVPEIYGDPCELLPQIWPGHQNKKYKLGIIPHYVDSKIALKMFSEERIIDIINTPEGFINEICECEEIWSSSLHGLIIPQLYGIKTKHIKLSNNVIGGNFKFNDYRLWNVNVASLLQTYLTSH